MAAETLGVESISKYEIRSCSRIILNLRYQLSKLGPDGEIRSVWSIRSRMAESTSSGRSEAGWPNQHQAADPKPNGQINIGRSQKPIGRLRLKANDRINIRRSEATSGGRRSRATDPTTGHGRTQAEVKRPNPDGRSRRQATTVMPLPTPAVTKTGLLRGTMVLSPRRPPCHYPRQRLPKPPCGEARRPLLHDAHHSASHANG